MKYRIIAMLLVVAVLAALAFVFEDGGNGASSYQAPSGADDSAIRNMKLN